MKRTGNNGELNARQKKAAFLLARGATQTEVAKEVKVTTETIRLWRKNPDFHRYFDILLKESEREAITKLRALNSKAVETISEVMEEDSKPAVRLKAALSVINLNALQDKVQNITPPQLSEDELVQRRAYLLHKITSMLGCPKNDIPNISSCTSGVS